jgi:membrane-anchored protein YejM (alkaline phosphatase superfamily)
MINRYANAASFLDEEVDQFLRGLDPQRHLIAMTGDHGESFGEDGAWVHSSRLSDAQTRVPAAIVGAGVPRGVIEDITTHADLMPTLLHAIFGRSVRMPGTSGRDLMIEAPPGQAFLCWGTPDDWNALLVRGDQRLGMKLKKRSAPEIVGLYSDKGLPDLEAVHDRGTIRTWAKAVQTEWNRLSP